MVAIRGRAKGSPGGGKGGWVASQASALGPGDFFQVQKKALSPANQKTKL